MRGLLCPLLAMAISVPAYGVIVKHVSIGSDHHVSTWRGGYNYSDTYGKIQNWPNTNTDASVGEFDKAALQSAIDSTISTYGGWDAKIIVTQVQWGGQPPIPGDLNPVAGSVDIDQDTLVWGQSTYYNAGSGNWMYNATSYSNFVAVVNAGVANGDSVIVDNPAWQAVWDTALPAACWDIVIDVPESLITAYLDNPSSDGLFASAKNGPVDIYSGDQWSQQANLRVEITQPPQTAPWITLTPAKIELTQALTHPIADPQDVTVTNAGTGTLSWTASEAPDQTWMSLQNASGGGGDSFQVLINVTGLSPGQYSGAVEVSDPGANNDPQILPVNITVLLTQLPVLELLPDSLSYQVATLDPPPAAQSVTVNNVGFGSLSWSAAVQGSPTWIWLTSATGSDGDSFDVQVDHTSLSRGIYSANVEVTDPTASNSPQVLPVTLELRDQDADIDVANSYDDAWETDWVAYCRSVHAGWSGTDGFAVHLGDSITYANAYGQWARYGGGKTQDDIDICNWLHSSDWPGGGNNSASGWYLAAYDMPGGRSYTAESGIRTDQYISGAADLPSMDQMYTLGFTNPDGKQYRDAEVAVVMLGTNDASGNRQTSAMIADLETIIDKLLANKIIVALSTLPPKRVDMTDVQNYNTAIRNLAQTKQLPLIDFYEEVMRRRPGDTWDGTLISGDGVHPTASSGGYLASSDPYAGNGAALSWSGYLLRCWLSVQKIQEIWTKVIDAPTGPGDMDGDGDVDLEDYTLLLAQFTGPVPPEAYQESSGTVVIEAEHYSAKTDGSGAASGIAWNDLSGNGSLGDGYVQALPNSGVGVDAPNIESSAPHLSYQINFTAAGTRYLWVKGWGDGGADDSVHYGLNGTAASTGFNDSAVVARTGAFEWTSHRGNTSRTVITVSGAGQQSFDLWMREDGARLDRLLLTTSSSYDPSLSEPPESSRQLSFSGDFDGDGDVDLSDFTIFAANFTGSL